MQNTSTTTPSAVTRRIGAIENDVIAVDREPHHLARADTWTCPRSARRAGRRRRSGVKPIQLVIPRRKRAALGHPCERVDGAARQQTEVAGVGGMSIARHPAESR